HVSHYEDPNEGPYPRLGHQTSVEFVFVHCCEHDLSDALLSGRLVFRLAAGQRSYCWSGTLGQSDDGRSRFDADARCGHYDLDLSRGRTQGSTARATGLQSVVPPVGVCWHWCNSAGISVSLALCSLAWSRSSYREPGSCVSLLVYSFARSAVCHGLNGGGA